MTRNEAIAKAENVKRTAEWLMAEVTSMEHWKELNQMATEAERMIKKMKSGEHC